LVKRIHELGGIQTMFLTHQDDVADHAQFATEFGCERVMHEADIGPDTAVVERKIPGMEPVALDHELLVIPTPGHTRGSACLLYRDAFLLSGDHLAWSPRLGHLYAFKDACWHDWQVQISAMERLAKHRFKCVLPGHGWPLLTTFEDCAMQMERCLEWMRGQVARVR
jgi:glyoxylase-like metal-dependent hydrolase (beta-lactamase superfamily II)